MICRSLLTSDFSPNCQRYNVSYIQKVVLINKADLDNVNIVPFEFGRDKHRISFSLKNNKKGVVIEAFKSGNSMFGQFSKKEKDNLPLYEHSLQIVIFGINEQIKRLLYELDFSTYFGVALHSSGIVEVYGFNTGLKTADYNVDVANNKGGFTVNLKSSELDNDMPFIYVNNGREISDFENAFADVYLRILGEYNSDFSNDFKII